MKYKIKENIKIDSLTFKKKVIDTSIALIGDTVNFTETDIRFYAMISLLDLYIDEDVIMNTLTLTEGLENKMYSEIEPVFEEVLNNNLELHNIYENIVNDLIIFYKNNLEYKKSITSVIYKLADDISNIKQEEILEFVTSLGNFITSVSPKITEATDRIEDRQEITKEIVKESVDNLKIMELIEHFK